MSSGLVWLSDLCTFSGVQPFRIPIVMLQHGLFEHKRLLLRRWGGHSRCNHSRGTEQGDDPLSKAEHQTLLSQTKLKPSLNHLS
jgi:hypothetical protein